ncbi:MAG: hypothetical protein A3B70_08035 [Deltaproteobacteria bacterium RIFCSPHIGHO2_02_FULL_40_11]|nr:MAG: hypothetical protein A3B70_08035 [Deltaproteobacteria bacterium RIFCSPHIGHO2_02_FULL_40_11]
MKRYRVALFLLFVLPLFALKSFEPSSVDTLQIIKIDVTTKEQRTQIANLGFAIEQVSKDHVVAIGRYEGLADLKKLGFSYQAKLLSQHLLDFPAKDSDFHNYSEMEQELLSLALTYSEIATLYSIGESVEGKELYMMHITGDAENVHPGILFLGLHHAREHLSAEVPLFLMKHLLENYGKDANITRLVDSRDIYILPMVNPDGAEYDITEPNPYKWWRKNRKGDEHGNIYGVDLNRNYGYKWGGEGAGSSKTSETYRGPSEFSEPETQAIKNFVETKTNLTTLLSYHTFSELILYPWGYTYDGIEDKTARETHETLAKEMAQMTGYTPQQSSDLYITSGDTTDWSYGKHGLISFTFELYPGSLFEGGFYPSAKKIQDVVENNLPAALYLIDMADNPKKVLVQQ